MWCLIHLKMKEIEKGVKISLSCCFIFFSYLKHSCRQEIQIIIPRWNDFCDVRFRGLNKKKEKQITIFAVLICFTFFPQQALLNARY